MRKLLYFANWAKAGAAEFIISSVIRKLHQCEVVSLTWVDFALVVELQKEGSATSRLPILVCFI